MESGTFRRAAASLVFGLLLVGAPGIAAADDYDSAMAGHPLRVIGYIVYPVGVLVDTLIFRPAHWIVSHEPIQSFFGHENEG
jgi:hypothetical protein